jgi:hypothetical protein
MVSFKRPSLNRKKRPYTLWPTIVQSTHTIVTERVRQLPCAYCHRETHPGWAFNIEQRTFRVLFAPLVLGQELKLCTGCKLVVEEHL